jgi:hypothetical protein
MNTKLILATLAGGILYFLLGWLIYGVLLMDFSMANTTQYAGLMKEMPDLLVLFLGNLSFALLMAWIFQKWANISSAGSGFSAGLFIGFLFAVTVDFMFYSMMNLYSITMVIVDIITTSVMSAIIGACIAWVLGFKSRTIS